MGSLPATYDAVQSTMIVPSYTRLCAVTVTASSRGLIVTDFVISPV